MADRLWSDTQLLCSHFMFVMVQMTGRCVSPHPFATLTAFLSCIDHLATVLSIEGTAQLFGESLCAKMGYDYTKVMAGSGEEACRI